jgi:predicted DNA-binding protein (MmcQ/YjbR family)
MSRTISDAVRELCLGLPGTEEVISHGHPNFKVNGKTFATFTINHHGDGRVALNVHSPAGTQQLYTEMEPEHYFVPPYVGPKGWLGIELNRGIDWKTVGNRVGEAYQKVAGKELAAAPRTSPPDGPMQPAEIDPFLGARAVEVMTRLKTLCESLPETVTATQFGNPVWKAGKKTFVSSHYYRGRLSLQFWVGADQQAMLSYDPRYSIPAYIGGNGWIDLDVEEHTDWTEIEYLLDTSYRHYALKRMLKALELSP